MFLYAPLFSPIQNAIVERNYRRNFESTHAMLNDSGLPAIFWSYAADYSTSVYNCLSTDTAYDYMSPNQARYGLVVDLSRCLCFGCLCYIHIPSETRQKHFVDKAYKSYILSIHQSTQAYLVWIIDTSIEKVTPNVLFDE